MDTQTAHRLQAEEQARQQHLNFQPVRQVNQSVQASVRQNSQHQSVGQVRCNSYSGYNQLEIGILRKCPTFYKG